MIEPPPPSWIIGGMAALTVFHVPVRLTSSTSATERLPAPTPHAEDLLVLPLGSCDAVDRVLARLAVAPVPSANPYWDQVGLTVADPDGFRVVLVADRWR